MVKHAGIERLLGKARADTRLLAVILFGSCARGEAQADSDVDVCLVLAHDAGSRTSSEVLLEYRGCSDLDVVVFQRLPIYIRQRVLRDGSVLHVRDEDLLYDVALRTIQEFEDFRPLYRAYLEEVARGGP